MADILRAPLKAAIVAGFVVAVLLLMINPPSLSGVSGLLVLIGVGLMFAIATAWAFVALTGRDSMDDTDFERLIRRSEALAQEPGMAFEATDFELLVAEAIDRLPPEFQQLLGETPVVVSHRGHESRAYGHYMGDTVARDYHHDKIIIYQDTLERDFGWDRDLLRAQVERTVRHELAHHLGWDERGVADLGL
jgi:predicted Zn-dependent protease with MMP-like domain